MDRDSWATSFYVTTPGGGQPRPSDSSLCFEGEEPAPLVGVFRERNALGLDAAGDLELRQTGWVVGLVYLVFPTVFSSEAQYRFPRVACPEREPSLAP